MSVDLSVLVARANALLLPERFDDYLPEWFAGGRARAGAASGFGCYCQSGADRGRYRRRGRCDSGARRLLLEGEAPTIVGMKRRRLSCLLQHGISLLAYHLPLDAHPTLGNNAQLAHRLGIEITGGLQPDVQFPNRQCWPACATGYGREVRGAGGVGARPPPLLVAGGTHPIRSIAWCTGGAQDYIEQAATLGVDAFLTGEISEQTVHSARELGIHFFAAGHHATERYGVAALGECLAREFSIAHRFIDIDSPA